MSALKVALAAIVAIDVIHIFDVYQEDEKRSLPPHEKENVVIECSREMEEYRPMME